MLKFNFSTTILLTILFPWVGFIPKMDNQPLFVVVYSILVVFTLRNIRISQSSLFLFVWNIALFFVAIAYNSEWVELKFILTYCYLFTAILLLSIYIDNNKSSFKCSTFVYVYAIYAAIGVIQFFVPDFFSFLVTRSAEDALTLQYSGRGVRSVTPEPATLGKLFNILTLCYSFFYYKDNPTKFKKRVFYVLLINCLFVAIISRSAYALLVAFLITWLFCIFFYKRYALVSTLMVLFVVPIAINSLSIFDGLRLKVILDYVYNNPSLLLEQGAIKRLFNIPISINNLFYFGIGGSLASAETFNATIQTPLGPLSYIAASKNVGGYIEILLQLGVFSIPILIYYVYRLFLIKMNTESNQFAYWLIASVVLLTLQDGTPSLVLTWFILIALGERYRDRAY